LQRLLLHLQGDLEPPRAGLARQGRGQRAPRPRRHALRRPPQDHALRGVARRRHRCRSHCLEGEEQLLGHAHRRPLRLSPAAPEPGRPLGRPACADQGRGHRRRARRPRRRLHHQDAVLRQRARPRGGARGLARLHAQQARRPHGQRGRRARGRLPVVLPAVRRQPGRPAAQQRGPQHPRALPLRAHRARLRAHARGDRPRHAPRQRAAVPRQVGRPQGRPRAARQVLRRRAARQVRVVPGVQGRLPGVQGRPGLPAHRDHLRS